MPHIFFTDKGKGFPVIFIHGFCETHKLWDNFKKPFIAHYRVITIDLPGFGKSPLPHEAFSIQDIAHEVLQLLETLNLTQSVIIAHSLGGYVTLEMVKSQPHWFAGFSLFHSTALPDSSEKKNSRNKTIHFVENQGVEKFATSFVPALFFHKNRKGLERQIDEVVKIAATTSKKSLIAYTKAMRDRQDRTEVLRQFKGPISIIAGDKDTSVPLEKIKEQELLPKQGIVNVLKDTGHMGMFEQPEKTTAIIRKFLSLCNY